MERTAGMESRAKMTSVSLDGDEGQQENGDGGAAIFEDEELVLTQAEGMVALEHGDPARFGGLVRLGRNDQADGGDQDDAGEDVGQPIEAGEQGDAAGDEEAAHDDGAGHSPEEDLGLMAGIDLEEAEEEQEDEEVVDGHRLFENVAGQVLDGGGGVHAEVQVR